MGTGLLLDLLLVFYHGIKWCI